jgi:predicted permease
VRRTSRNLLLARGTARRREIALRLALGAGRARIVGQLLAESLLLAFAGLHWARCSPRGAAGLLVALRPFGNTSVVFDLPLDARVLTFTIAVAVTTSLLFGLAPALRATRSISPQNSRAGTRLPAVADVHGSARGSWSFRLRFSLVLLVTTGLFMRTLSHLQAVEAGFNRHNLVLFTVDASSAGTRVISSPHFTTACRARLEKVPRVRASAFSRVPLLSRVRANNTITVQGSSPPPDAAAGVNTNGVSSNFFAAMELPIIVGRSFTDHDDTAAPRVAVVNQTLVKKYFGQENPIGRRLVYTLGPFGSFAADIVGVAGDAKYTDLRAPAPPTMYLPASQLPGGTASFALRVAVEDPAAVFPSIRAAVRDIDPTLPCSTSARRTSRSIACTHRSGCSRGSPAFSACWRWRWLRRLVWPDVLRRLRRTAEIGLRLALGARPSQVVR